MRLLLKASEERDTFHDLIGTDVTFAEDIFYVDGKLMYSKGEKAFISDVLYNPGYYCRVTDFHVQAKISKFQINGIPGIGGWRPDTFVEHGIKNERYC